MEGGEKEHIIRLEGGLAVAAYLFKNWLEGLDYMTIGKGDYCDSNFNSKVIEVKTGRQPEHDILMVPKKQWIKHADKYDFCIGCNEIAEDWIRIWDYINEEQFEENGEWKDFGHGDTLCMSFNKLNNIAELKQVSV